MRAPFVRSVLTDEAVVGEIEGAIATMPLCPTPPRAEQQAQASRLPRLSRKVRDHQYTGARTRSERRVHRADKGKTSTPSADTPLPRTTTAPRASRRRDGSSGRRNGHEARATSLQIKRLLLSLAKCAASAGVRGSKPLGATRAALTVPRAAPCRAQSALDGRRELRGH